MEMVERYSSFASFSNDQAFGYKKAFHLVKSNYSHLHDKITLRVDKTQDKATHHNQFFSRAHRT